MVTASFNMKNKTRLMVYFGSPTWKNLIPNSLLALVLLSGFAVFFHMLLDRVSQRVWNRQTAYCANKKSVDNQNHNRKCVLFGFIGFSYGVSLNVIFLD